MFPWFLISDFEADASRKQLEPVFNPSDGMEVFSQFLKLCENTALLGDRILQAVASVLSIGPQEMSAAGQLLYDCGKL